MLRVCIDICVFAGSDSAFGRITGALEFPVLPRAGELLSFIVPHADVPPMTIEEFSGVLRIERVVHVVGAGADKLSLQLEDVRFRSPEGAAAFMAYLQQGFGLISELCVEGDND